MTITVTGSALERAKRINAMEDALLINSRTQLGYMAVVAFAIGFGCTLLAGAF